MKDEMEEIKNCPDCGKRVLWGNMIWLNGKTRCPQCHEKEHWRIKHKDKAKKEE